MFEAVGYLPAVLNPWVLDQRFLVWAWFAKRNGTKKNTPKAKMKPAWVIWCVFIDFANLSVGCANWKI